MDATADLTGSAAAAQPASEPVDAEASLTALVPCFNEGAQVEAVHAAIDAALSGCPGLEILFVDDGSSDDTLARIRQVADGDPRVRYLSFSRNFGLEAAFSAGFRYARTTWVAQLDADLQSPPAEALRLLAKAREGFDVVYGIRRQRRDPWARRLGSTVQQWLARRLFGIDLIQGASAFRVIRASVARRAVELPLAMPYLIATLPLIGARAATVDVVHAPRTAGGSRWSPWRLAAHSVELFVGFSLRPLVWAYVLTAISVTALLATTLGVAVGALEPVTGVAVVLAGQAVATSVLAVVAGYVHRLVRGAVRPAQFYIRDANVPIAPEHSLYGARRSASALEEPV